MLGLFCFLFSFIVYSDVPKNLERPIEPYKHPREIPAPTLHQLRMVYMMGKIYKNMQWDVVAEKRSIEPYEYPTQEYDDGPIVPHYEHFAFFDNALLEGKPLFVWEKYGVWVDRKQVCKLLMPKKKVKTKRWFECNSVKCEEQISAEEKEVIVPDYPNYGMYSMDSTDFEQKECPIDYEFSGDPNFMIVHADFIPREDLIAKRAKGNALKVIANKQMYAVGTNCNVYNLSPSDLLPNGKRCNPSYYGSTSLNKDQYKLTNWEYRIWFSNIHSKQEDIRWCKGKGRQLCIKDKAWIRKLICKNNDYKQCPDGKQWDFMIDELMNCMWRLYPGTKFQMMSGDIFKCEYDRNTKEIIRIDFPEAFWPWEELHYYPEKYDVSNPLIIVPELPW